MRFFSRAGSRDCGRGPRATVVHGNDWDGTKPTWWSRTLGYMWVAAFQLGLRLLPCAREEQRGRVTFCGQSRTLYLGLKSRGFVLLHAGRRRYPARGTVMGVLDILSSG